MEFLFGLDQSNVCRDIEKIESLIRDRLLTHPPKKKLYDVAKRLKTKEEEVETYFPGFMAFTDCSAEQPIPTHPDQQKNG